MIGSMTTIMVCRMFRFCSCIRLRVIFMLQGMFYALFIGACLTLWIHPEIYFRWHNRPVETILARNTLIEIRSLLVQAHRRARLVYTKTQIVSALQTLDELVSVERSEPSPGDPTYPRLPEVCPEVRITPNSDALDMEPFYETEQCARQPIKETVTVLLLIDSCEQLDYLLERIQSVYPQVPVKFALNYDSPSLSNCPFASHATSVSHETTEAGTWIALAQQATSKYILVGRNMVDFTRHTDLDRMLRVMNDWAVDIVGGAVRLEPEGRWYAGCYKSALRNFTIRLQPGHDLSVQSCAYCDYIASPFLVKRDFFLKYMRSYRTGHIVPFVDLFLQLAHSDSAPIGRAVSCLDVMFHVAGHWDARGHGLSETPRRAWTELVRRWTVTRLILPGSVEHSWNCTEVDIHCYRYTRPGYLMPPCCLWELSHCVRSFLSVARENEISTCLTSENLLGAVKLYSGFTPWTHEFEVVWEADKLVRLGNYVHEKLDQLSLCRLGQREYMTSFRDNIRACAEQTNFTCVYHILHSPNWQITLSGQPRLVCERREGLLRVTRVPLDGYWTRTVFNPGRFARHQHGDDVLAPFVRSDSAAEHALKLIRHQLDTNPYAAPRHARVDGQFGSSGNTQFQEILV